MLRLLFFLPLIFFLFSCEAVYSEGDELFYQISEADSTRCMEEILDEIWEEGEDNLYRLYHIYESDVPYCGIKNVISVMINRSEQIMARCYILSNETEVSSVIYEYFMFNRNLTSSEMYQLSMNPNYEGFERLFYSTFSDREMERQLKSNREELHGLLTNNQSDTSAIHRMRKYVADSERKLSAQKLIEERLRLYATPAHIRFSYSSEGEKWKTVKRKIELAYYQMRNYECMRYFGETYLHLYERSQRKGKDLDKQKLEALKTMHPAIIINNNWSKRDK